jgi:hypothetical protein
VDLPQVDVVGVQQLKGAVELTPGIFGATLSGLGGQKYLASNALHRRTHAFLSVPIGRRCVEMVGPRSQRLPQRRFGDLRRDIAQRRRPVDEHAGLVTDPA